MERENYKSIFKKTLVDFLDSLIEILPSEPNLIVARIHINDKVESDSLINYFIFSFMDPNKPYKEAVEKHNEKPFLEAEKDKENGKSIFGNLPDEIVSHFKYLWRSNSISNDNKRIIWKWLSSLVKIVERYQECK